MFDTARPYIASYLLARKDNKIAFVLRANTGWMDGYYGLPAGKTEKSESFSAGALREASEEIGITVSRSDLKFVHAMHRQDDKFDWVDVFFETSTWEGEPYNVEPKLHSDVVWLDLDNLPENVIPHMRYAIEQITAGNPYSEYGWPITQ